MSKTVGVLGTGLMGGNMVQRLLDTGYTVYTYDTQPSARQRMADIGAVACQSAKELADSTKTILTSLPNSKILEIALLQEGFLRMMQPGSILVETSSTMPETIESVGAAAASAHINVLDCPVSGGPNEALAGKLVMIMAGLPAVLEACHDVIDKLGEKQFYVGEKLGTAKAVKIVNNTMSMGNLAVASEAFALGVHYGLDPQRLYDIVKVSGGTSNQFSKRFQKVVDGDYTALATVETSRKDLTLAIDWAETKGIPMKIARLARSYYEMAIQNGHGDEDMCSVYHMFL